MREALHKAGVELFRVPTPGVRFVSRSQKQHQYARSRPRASSGSTGENSRERWEVTRLRHNLLHPKKKRACAPWSLKYDMSSWLAEYEQFVKKQLQAERIEQRKRQREEKRRLRPSCPSQEAETTQTQVQGTDAAALRASPKRSPTAAARTMVVYRRARRPLKEGHVSRRRKRNDGRYGLHRMKREFWKGLRRHRREVRRGNWTAVKIFF